MKSYYSRNEIEKYNNYFRNGWLVKGQYSYITFELVDPEVYQSLKNYIEPLKELRKKLSEFTLKIISYQGDISTAVKKCGDANEIFNTAGNEVNSIVDSLNTGLNSYPGLDSIIGSINGLNESNEYGLKKIFNMVESYKQDELISYGYYLDSLRHDLVRLFQNINNDLNMANNAFIDLNNMIAQGLAEGNLEYNRRNTIKYGTSDDSQTIKRYYSGGLIGGQN